MVKYGEIYVGDHACQIRDVMHAGSKYPITAHLHMQKHQSGHVSAFSQVNYAIIGQANTDRVEAHILKLLPTKCLLFLQSKVGNWLLPRTAGHCWRRVIGEAQHRKKLENFCWCPPTFPAVEIWRERQQMKTKQNLWEIVVTQHSINLRTDLDSSSGSNQVWTLVVVACADNHRERYIPTQRKEWSRGLIA